MANPSGSKWYYSIPAVFLALFVLGPFGFPLLWKSPGFNLFWKMAITAVITGLTIYLCVASWQLIVFLMREIRQAASLS